jgi:hypothetical protein
LDVTVVWNTVQKAGTRAQYDERRRKVGSSDRDRAAAAGNYYLFSN